MDVIIRPCWPSAGCCHCQCCWRCCCWRGRLLPAAAAASWAGRGTVGTAGGRGSGLAASPAERCSADHLCGSCCWCEFAVRSKVVGNDAEGAGSFSRGCTSGSPAASDEDLAESTKAAASCTMRLLIASASAPPLCAPAPLHAPWPVPLPAVAAGAACTPAAAAIVAAGSSLPCSGCCDRCSARPWWPAVAREEFPISCIKGCASSTGPIPVGPAATAAAATAAAAGAVAAAAANGASRSACAAWIPARAGGTPC